MSSRFDSASQKTVEMRLHVLENSMDGDGAESQIAEPIFETTITHETLWKTLLVLRQHLGNADLNRFRVSLALAGSRDNQCIPLVDFWSRHFLKGLGLELTTGCLANRFQPIVSRSTMKIYGHELLVHYADQETQFNAGDLLRHAGNDAERLAIERLCWMACIRGLKNLPTGMLGFVNVNPQLFFNGLTNWTIVEHALQESSVSKARVVTEILESATPYDPSSLREFVADCRRQGFSIALDDWGRQSHSLAMLDLVRPDFLKLEMETVRGCHEDHYRRTMVNGIIELCRKLKTRIILEGIESRQDWDWAKNTGADLVQGYFLGRPVTQPIESLAIPATIVLGPHFQSRNVVEHAATAE
jgi:EAL domain-containing protein (putative c-di-GMP-specific phosphodiesterase class I)